MHVPDAGNRIWTVRTFIAIELPESIQSALADIQGDLKGSDADVRWVRPENIHLTLKFLGAVQENVVSSITEILRKVSANYGPFGLTVSGVGVFPHGRSPRVIWVGINESSVLTDLQAAVEGKLEPLGFEREKRTFRAHLTLGRVKSSRGKRALMERAERYGGREFGSFDVETISLMESKLNPGGAKYTRVAEIRLGKE